MERLSKFYTATSRTDPVNIGIITINQLVTNTNVSSESCGILPAFNLPQRRADSSFPETVSRVDSLMPSQGTPLTMRLKTKTINH